MSVIIAPSTQLGCWLQSCCRFRPRWSPIRAWSCAEDNFLVMGMHSLACTRLSFNDKCNVHYLLSVFKFYPRIEAFDSQDEPNPPTSHSTHTPQAVAAGAGEPRIISWSCLTESKLYLSCFWSSLAGKNHLIFPYRRPLCDESERSSMRCVLLGLYSPVLFHQ